MIQVDEFRQEMTTEDGEQVTVFHTPEVYVENRAERALLVVNGEETDITDALLQDGRYVYEQTTEGDTKLSITVTGSPEKWEMEVSMCGAGEETYSYVVTSEGSWLTPGIVHDYQGIEGMVGLEDDASAGAGGAAAAEKSADLSA